MVQLREQRHEVRMRAETGARFAAALLQVRLQAGLRTIQIIAQSPAFDDSLDRPRFTRLARRIVASQPDLNILSIATPEGWRILDVPVPVAGQPGGRVVEMESLRRVVRTRKPAIGTVVRGPQGRLAFAVRAPVVQGGRVRYVVSGVANAERLKQLLQFQPFPEGWSASIVDANGHAVASVPDDSNGGRDPARTFFTWAPVGGTDWKVRIGTPIEDLARPQRTAVLILSAAAVLSLALVAILARLLASEIHQLRMQEVSALQSQRMEALGRLTGGVAHDFNNLLTPIIGGLDLIGRRTDDARIKRYVATASASAERAKSLVARLLAFSRRQSLSPRPVDLARLLDGMTDLLDRSLTPAIRVAVDVREALPPALADPSQLELAILNLAINARDAMPDGGLLRISAGEASADEAAGLPPGPYLYLRISDTGTGMDEETLAQAVDPFFTTKALEKGTGLGLSMVHGFAAQSGGALHLASVIGHGTTATIILPQSMRTIPDLPDRSIGTHLPPGRLLLVDDDDAVRTITAAILADAGQTVLQAASVDEALAILGRERDLDALITDFVMPARSGGELIALVRAQWPDLPILLITGYVSETEALPPDVPRLMKPFDREALIVALAALQARRHS